MEIPYSVYFSVLAQSTLIIHLIAPAIIWLFALIRVIFLKKKEELKNELVKLLFLTLFLLCFTVTSRDKVGSALKLASDYRAESIHSEGVVTSVVSDGTYDHNNHTGWIVGIDGETYFVFDSGSLYVNKAIEFEYLPNSRVIVCWN